jgi:pimeloyl-ACP methyl ester carboxylesterase
LVSVHIVANPAPGVDFTAFLVYTTGTIQETQTKFLVVLMTLQIPEPRNSFDLTMGDGAIIRVRQHGNPDGPRIFFGNGNGFGADGYYAFWGPLCDRFDVTVFDFRNHGRNPLAASGLAGHNYAQMTLDLERVFREVTARDGEKTNIGIFHSMAGRTAMKHAVEIGFRWDVLFLFDPPNVPLPGHPEYERMDVFEHKLADWAMHRPDRFKDPSELAEQYRANRAHSTWVEGTHELMARAVLREDPEQGGWALSCPREFEASIYLQAMTLNLWPSAAELGGPVKLIAGDPEAKGAPGPAFANRALGEDSGYHYECIPGTGHLLQVQKPEECRQAMFTFLKEQGIAF